MARPLRIAYPGAVYHVTARGNARQAIVRDDADRQRFVATLADTVTQYRVLCHAWVLLNNHYHLLLETPHANLSAALRHLNGVYTQAFNRRHRRVGHLFQGRFTAILVEKDRYLLALSRYIVLNPVRAQLVRHPRAWRWSSYRATSGEGPAEPWLTSTWLLGQFGQRRGRAHAAYRQFVNAGLRQQPSPWAHLVGQIYLGGEAFRRRAQHLVRRRPDPEIPHAQRSPARPAAARLLHQVATVYRVEVADLLKPTWRPSEARQVAMYLLRHAAGLSLRTIAARFGVGYSAVSHRISAVRSRLAEDPAFQARVGKCKIKT
ncbi:MAG: REP-associated tyrosine transposase [Candidatus Methylomirabilales bacterium]